MGKFKKITGGNDNDKAEVYEKFPWLADADFKNAIVDISKSYLIWHNGTWNSGIWHCGIWNGGIFKWGFWKHGIWKGGTWEEGLWRKGLWHSPNPRENTKQRQKVIF